MTCRNDITHASEIAAKRPILSPRIHGGVETGQVGRMRERDTEEVAEHSPDETPCETFNRRLRSGD